MGFLFHLKKVGHEVKGLETFFSANFGPFAGPMTWGDTIFDDVKPRSQNLKINSSTTRVSPLHQVVRNSSRTGKFPYILLHQNSSSNSSMEAKWDQFKVRIVWSLKKLEPSTQLIQSRLMALVLRICNGSISTASACARSNCPLRNGPVGWNSPGFWHV